MDMSKGIGLTDDFNQRAAAQVVEHGFAVREAAEWTCHGIVPLL